MNYYYYLTAAGKQISESLQQQFGGVLRGKEEFTDATLAQDFRSAELLVFVLATGIAVRKLAPLLRTKCTDPAVLVVSQDQRYVISLLSGHLGGANDWTRKIAAFLHAEPVITTATDLQGQLAFDEVAKNNHLAIENISVLKQISGALLNGKSIWLQSDLPVTGTEQYPQISFSEQANSAGKVVISDRTQTRLETLPTLYLRPKDLVIGVGCKKSIPFVHLETCFLSFLETYQYACDSIKAMATISRKQAEPAILQLCETYHIPLQIVPDADIRACGNLFEASAFVQQVTGLPSVSEACSYLAAGKGTILTRKVKYAGVTLHMTTQAVSVLETVDVIVGYTTYIQLLQEQFPDKQFRSTPMRQEIDRCKLAVSIALEGKTVALVSSGDSGIYGMTGILLEVIAAEQADVEVIAVPGVTAASAAAAILGAPLMHDFAVISLSDLMTPLSLIQKRITCAAEADFVICLYNPKSKKRTTYLADAADRIAAYRTPDTPVGIVRNAGRPDQTAWFTTLSKLKEEPVDMFCVVLIGNSQTYLKNGKMITPRGYNV